MMDDYQNSIINLATEFARSRMKSLMASHGWDHVKRVLHLADKITVTEKDADPFIVKVSTILHDIARIEEDSNPGKVCHALLGSEIALAFLLDAHVDPSAAEHISQCILSHRFRNSHEPRTIEAKILYDADKLDSIGAVGIGRAFLFSGEVGAKLHDSDVDIHSTKPYSEDDTAYREYIAKLQYVKDRMLTREGKKIARERHNFMEVFFKRIDDEVKGIL